MKMTDIDVLAVQNQLGEGPVWIPGEQALYWTDIRRMQIHRFFPASAQLEFFQLDDLVTFIAPRRNGGWIISTRDSLAFWKPEQSKPEIITSPLSGQDGIRFNDGAIDCQGRLWVGSMNEKDPEGRDGLLFRMDPDLSLQVVDSGFTISNGIDWSPDNRWMYFTDTLSRTIFRYEFAASDGTIANRKEFIRVPEQEGYPDGLCVDSRGFLWSAQWAGSRVVCYAPDGKPIDRLDLPAEHITSCAFGGEKLDQLFITSAWDELGEERRRQQPHAGDLFKVPRSVRGKETYQFGG